MRGNVRCGPVGQSGTRELHLIRDRFGEKPLYYGWLGEVFAFGSELKAVCALPGFGAELDRRAVARYLRHNCIPAPDTIWRGVRKLLPGHLVTVAHSPNRGRASRTTLLLVRGRRGDTRHGSTR